MSLIVARLFNTIGPRQTGQYGMVVPRFIEKALKGEDISIYGTGGQSRCFCYVGDVVDALISLVGAKGAAGKVYNVGSNEEITIEEIADLIIKKTDSSSSKKFVSYEEAYGRPFDDMLRRVPSLERIESIIRYGPVKSLDETLDIIIDYWREKL